MRSLLLPIVLLAGLVSSTHADPLRLIDIVPNPGAADGETSFGRSLDWDDTEILVGDYPSVHVFDSLTRKHKYRLGENVTLPSGFAIGFKVLITPDHFLTVASRVNRQDIIYIFRRSDGGFERTISSPSGSTYEPGFGRAFALEGNRLFVSILHNTPVGEATAVGGVYVYDIQNWTQEPQIFRQADGEWFDGFGNSISVEGNILAVGANRKGSSFQGAVYLFDATSRALITKITGAVADGWFGTSVLLRNGKLYVTSRSAVWEYDAATGNYLGKFSPVPAAGYYDWFGSDVEVVGDLLVVWSDRNLYQFDLETRQQVAALVNPLDTGTFTTRAGEMKARGEILLTGASGGTDPGTKNGALLAFTKLALGPVVEVADATGSETQGEVPVTFRVNPPSSQDVTVNFETRQDSAREGMDFIARSGSVTIPAGMATATIMLTVVDDVGREPTERFFLDILGGTGAVITPTEVELWITDNDTSLSVPVSSSASVPLPTFTGDDLGKTIVAFSSSAFVGSLDLDGSGLLRGGVFAFDLQTRQVMANIEPTGFEDGARFGQGLAVDEELLAVGAYKSRADPAVPAIYLYDRKTLAERMVLLPPPGDYGGFGTKIALGESRILVGLPFEDRRGFQVGDVLVYDRATGAFLSRIESPTGMLGGQFGSSVTFSGTNAVIGTNGRVYCFDLNDNNRLLFEVERDTRDTAHIASDFGDYVQANEDFIVVGNPWDDSFVANSGSVLIFDAATGSHLNTVRTRFDVANFNFGNSISLMGSVLAVTDRNAGVDLVDIPTGHHLQHFTIPNSLIRSGFSQNVVLTESHVVVGAPWGKDIGTGRVISFSRVAFEPTLTSTTTKEDIMSPVTVINANGADYGLTSYFKITSILAGTLYQRNGTTRITEGSFITRSQAAAGLRFLPDTDLNSLTTPTFGFTAQASVSAESAGLRGGAQSASITVTPVNDVPTVVGDGLADQSMPVGKTLSLHLAPAFTDVEEDTLSFSISGNSQPEKLTATVTDTSLILTSLASGVVDLTVSASDNDGGTVSDTFSVAIGTVNPTPLQISTTGTLNSQNGLSELIVNVTNTTPRANNGFRLHVDYSAYLTSYPNLRLYNASSPPGSTDVYVDHPYPVALEGTVPVTLSFYTPTRSFPRPFSPILSVEILPTSAVSDTNGDGVQPRMEKMNGGNVLIEFPSIPGRWYRIRYSKDLINWFDCPIPIQANADRTQWIDSGAPLTPVPPSQDPCRFYRVNEVTVR